MRLSIADYFKEVFGSSSRPILYHYTTYGGLCGILADQTLRSTQVQFHDDPEEYHYGFRVLKGVVAGMSEFSSRFALIDQAISCVSRLHLCTCSFTLNGNSNHHREAFGDIAIGFNSERLGEIAGEKKFGLFPVVYTRKRQMEIVRKMVHDAALRFFNDSKDMSHCFMNLFQYAAPLFKSPKYQREREIRMISIYPHTSSELNTNPLKTHYAFCLQTPSCCFEELLESVTIYRREHADFCRDLIGRTPRSSYRKSMRATSPRSR